MGDWVRVGSVADWRPGRGRAVDLDGRKVAVFKTKDRWIALDDKCPHMGASLADGFVAGNEIQCSWHEWRYDVETGQCPLRPWACVRVYGIRIEGNGVFLERPDSPAPEPSTEIHDDEPEWLDWDPSRFFKKKPDDPAT